MHGAALTCRPILPWPLMILFCLLIVGVTVAQYVWLPRARKLLNRNLLTILRAIALAALFCCLLRPSLRITRSIEERAALAILVDRSLSMSFLDRHGTSRAELVDSALKRNANVIDRLAHRFDLSLLAFGDNVVPLEAGRKPSSGQTNIGGALSAVRRRLAGAKRGVVVLISDGANTSGPEPCAIASELKHMGLRVWTIGVGDPTAENKVYLNVADLNAPGAAAENDVIHACATVRYAVDRPQNIPIQVASNDVVIRTETRKVRTGASELRVDVPVTLAMPGREPRQEILAEDTVRLTFRAGPIAGDVIPADDQAHTFVKILPGKIGVGFCLSRPLWEAAFATRSLRADKRMNATIVYVPRSDSLEQSTQRLARLVAGSRVIVVDTGLVDVLSNAEWSALYKAVAEHGRGMLVLANGIDVEQLPPPFADLLPAVPVGTEIAKQAVRFTINPSGVLAKFFKKLTERKKEPPILEAFFRCGGVKSGAEIFASDESGEIPLLVGQRLGKGRSALLFAPCTWKWAMSSKESLKEMHRRLWRYMVLWLAGKNVEEKEKKLVLVPSKGRVVAGGQVELHALPRNNFDPGKGVEVRFSAQDQEGKIVWEEKQPWNASGMFAQFTPSRGGDLLLRVDAFRDDEKIASDTANVAVFESSVELKQVRPDFDLLKAIAASGGGEFRQLDQFSELLNRLVQYKAVSRVTRTTYQPLWTHPITFWVFVLALCCEWAIRRKNGLL